MTVFQVQLANTVGMNITLHLLPKVKIEVVVVDHLVEWVVDVISSVARTGEVGRR